MSGRPLPRVVVIGGGFGGLECAKALREEPVDVVLIDRHNYHLFTPLLYQVASCLLTPYDIAAPLRKVFRNVRNVRYRDGEVANVDLEHKQVRLSDGEAVDYDYVVIATGSVTNYYGNASVEAHALGLKDLVEAVELRNHVLACLDVASATEDADERRRHMTFCVVGGGPTGVEYAGALAELGRLILPAEYPELDRSEMQIHLFEGGDRVLPVFAPRLSKYAQRELQALGVNVRVDTLVSSADDKGVVLSDGTKISTATMVWTAGVRPNDPVDTPPRRIEVDNELRVVGAEGAFAIGDVAAAHDRKGDVLPMVSPPALQAGRYVARHILNGGARRPFRYRDKGTLATIGRRSAVGQVKGIQFTGFFGWIVWLVVHLYYLVGFENRIRVLLRWAWYYVRLDRPVRIILEPDPARGPSNGPTDGNAHEP